MPGYPLAVDPFDAAPRLGIALKNVRQEIKVRADGTSEVTTVATVFVRHGKLSFLAKRIEDYANARQTVIKSGAQQGKIRKLDNEPLISNIESIGIAAIEAFWVSRHPLPALDVIAWWEAWVRIGSEAERSRCEDAIIAETDRLGIERRRDRLILPEHTVFLIKATRRVLAGATALLNFISELRQPTVTAEFFMRQTHADEQQWTTDLRDRIRLPDDDAPAVCVLDTGTNRGHPLLSDVLAESDHDTVRAEWGRDDHYAGGHGTPMAGLAAYGDLTPLLESNAEVPLSHRLESVKILPRVGTNDPENYGAITQAAMSIAEANAPERTRVFALAITATDAPDFTESGKPSAWSAAIDSHASGAMETDDVKRLVCVSGGNVWIENGSQYPALNELTSFGDPAQSWNAITVGAYTEKDAVRDELGNLVLGSQCLARRGRLSPHSATTCLWTSEESRHWALKPDIVLEGGNVATDGAGNLNEHDSLRLLSTNATFQTRMFTPFCATSAATALAARMAAQIQASYPEYWPETVRALMITSADWTAGMTEGKKMTTKGHVRHILQRYGHGVPQLTRALTSASSRATLICQDSLQPFEKKKDGVKTKDMMLYRLPWPRGLLHEHAGTELRLSRDTLIFR